MDEENETEENPEGLYHLGRHGLLKEYHKLSGTIDVLSQNGGITDEERELIKERYESLESTREEFREEDKQYLKEWAEEDRGKIRERVEN